MHSSDNYIGRKRSILIYLLFAFSILTMYKFRAFSLSFIFGFVLVVTALSYSKFFFTPRGYSLLLLLFVIISYLSLLVSDFPSGNQMFMRIIQIFYWFLLALYVFNSYEYIDKKELSGVVFITVMVYLVINLKYHLVLRNEVAYTVIIMGPLGLFFQSKYWHRILYSLLLLFLMIILGSRTGALICLIQMILFFILFTPKIQKFAKYVIIFITIVLLLANLSPIRSSFGNLILPVNQRLGTLLIEPQEVFTNDISWLQRRAQIRKGIQIFEEHPFIGIGVFNFQNYNVTIDLSGINTNRSTIRNIDNRSSHNAYISLLSETGIIGFGTIVLMFLLTLVRLFVHLDRIGSSFEAAIFISFIGMLIYFYFISSFFGTSSWLLYGLCLGAAKHTQVS